MEYQFTSLMYPLLLVSVVAGVLAAYCLIKMSSLGAVFLASLSISVLVWSLGYALELSAVELAAKRFWSQCQYIGIVAAPVCWVAFILDYAGYRYFLSRRNLAFALMVPTITILLVFTTDRHGLIWRTTGLSQIGDVSLMNATYGAWFWVHFTYSYSLMLVGTVIIFRRLVQTSKLYRRQGFVLLIAVLAPWLGNAFHFLKLNPVYPLDLTPFAFTISLIMMASGTLKYRLIDISPIARDKVVEDMNSGMLVVDTRGNLVDINPLAQSMLGIVVETSVGQQISDVLGQWPELATLFSRDDPVTFRPVLVANATGTRKLEASISLLKGRHGRSANLGHVLLLNDVTDRLGTEDELRESENRNRAIVTAIPDLMFVHDMRGVILDYHASKPEALFAPPESFLGKGPEEIFPEEFSSAAVAIFQQVASMQQSQVFEYQLPISGRIQYFEARIVPYGDDKILSIVRDISDQKALEAQLLQAQKMEAVGRLTGGIAHDFNNLLQVVTGYAALASADLEPEHRVHEYIDTISEASSRAAALVSRLLLFSRQQIIQPSDHDLNIVVENLLKMLQRIIGEHIRLIWKPAKNIQPICADRNMVEQAIMNLCLNARDAMADGGDLLIQTRGGVLDESFCAAHRDVTPGRYTLLCVTDTGCGMDAETQKRVFEPFFTTKAVDRGTGLGLSTVYGIIKQHQGAITVESELAHGTSITLYWPVSDKP